MYFLCNLQPVLVPLPQTMSDNEVKGYCLELDDTGDELETQAVVNNYTHII